MKKVGILTFSNAKNYGALLQAYALKTVLNQLGNNAHIINFYSPKMQRASKFFYKYKPTVKWFVKRLFDMVFNPLTQYYNRRCFIPFCRKYIGESAPLFAKDLPTISSQYDLFITGSDQVFNPRLTEFDTNFFLDFSKDITKNASYAASFGFELKDFTEKEKEFIRQNLTHIKYLSVREKQGEEIIGALAPQQNSQVHLDPTLLLSGTQWQKIAEDHVLTQPYCLVYLLRRDPALVAYANKIARERKWKLLFISRKLDILCRMPGTRVAPTVEEWVGLFLNAQYVFTNSFHGLAFCVNFNKPFIVGQLNSAWPASSRLNNLLEITGLQHRVFNPTHPKLYEQEDWAGVNTKLDRERQKALDYLKIITQ